MIDGPRQAGSAQIALGDIVFDPMRRLIAGPAGSQKVEPKVAQFFAFVAGNANRLCSRAQLFEECWQGVVVGDDSLNRIARELRLALAAAGSAAVQLDTVARGGYVLAVDEAPAPSTADGSGDPVRDAIDCWRLGMPTSDDAAIDGLAAHLARTPDDADGWGWLALLHAKAAEYADADRCDAHIRQCERAAAKATAIAPHQPQAKVALARVLPIFGHWSELRASLEGALATAPDDPVALHERAVLDMATGRPSAAVPVIADLMRRDRLAAQYHYKRIYHLWTLGELDECERVAQAALQLWPRHPAIWSARFWQLVFTGRARHAALMTGPDADKPALPPPALAFLRDTALLVDEGGADASSAGYRAHVERCSAHAAIGPANAVASLLALCALDAVDAAFDVADGLYLGVGLSSAPARMPQGGLSITDQHRRITQPLFIPATSAMRADPRFEPLCEAIGLGRYWRENAIVPDYRLSGERA